MSGTRALVLAVALAGAQACHAQPESMMTITHSKNGLSVTLPETLMVDGVLERPTVTETPDGFKLALGARSRRRVKIEASVGLRAEASPPGAWPNEREINGRRIRYRVDRGEGGSGGTQSDFHAWEPYANGHLEYGQGDLVEEPGEPDFSLAWHVIAGTQPPLIRNSDSTTQSW
jgi:hypothetical protein